MTQIVSVRKKLANRWRGCAAVSWAVAGHVFCRVEWSFRGERAQPGADQRRCAVDWLDQTSEQQDGVLATLYS